MKVPEIQKLFKAEPDVGSEVITTLKEGSRYRLEHIASFGEASPEKFWYDQAGAEWVALLRGSATIEFESGVLKMSAGDAILIPVHCRHRVESVTVDAVWIALHELV